MRHALAAAIVVTLAILADAAPAAAQVLPPQFAGRVFLPVASNRRPLGQYATRVGERRWRTTENIIDVMRWDGHRFTVETLRRSRGFYHETVLRDAGGLIVFVFEDAENRPGAARAFTNSPAVDIENITLAGFADHATLRAYARSFLAECRASSDCDQSAIAWRGVTP